MNNNGNTTINLLKHATRRSFRSLWENLYLNTVAAGVIGASLLLLGVYTSVLINLNSIVDTWNRDVHISAYFSPDLSERDRISLRDEIQKMPEAVQVRYVSETDAKNWLTERVEGIESTIDALGDDALPASLEITLAPNIAQPGMIEEFATKLKGSDFEDIDYGVEWVEKFNAFLQLLQMLGTLLGILILLAATFLVTNTVHLVVYNRKNELEIAKLVGASDTYIISPFLFEGGIQGLAGALGAIAGLWIIHKTLTLRLQDALMLDIAGELQFLSKNHLMLLTVIGIGLGVISAFITTARFLRQAQ